MKAEISLKQNDVLFFGENIKSLENSNIGVLDEIKLLSNSPYDKRIPEKSHTHPPHWGVTPIRCHDPPLVHEMTSI